jgi:hypothetical protein
MTFSEPILNIGFLTRCYSFLNGVEKPKVFTSAVDPDLCSPFTSRIMPKNTIHSTLVVAPHRPVLLVLMVIYGTKITDPVVVFHSVDVVNLVAGTFSVMD